MSADADNAYFPVADNYQPEPGGLHAASLMTGERVWFAAPPDPLLCGELDRRGGCTPAQSAAVTVIQGAVLSGAFDGGLRAYSTEDGRVLWTLDTNREYDTLNGVPAHGGSLNGPAPVAVGWHALRELGRLPGSDG